MNGSINPIAPGLFAIGPQPPGTRTCVYYLTREDPAGPVETLEQMFTRIGLSGWFIFCGTPIGDPDDFRQQARSAFPALDSEEKKLPRGIVWLSDAATPAAYSDALVCAKSYPFPNLPQVIGRNHTFSWSGLGLLVTTSVDVKLDPVSSSLELYAADTKDVSLFFNGAIQNIGYYPGPNPWLIQIPLLGPAAGSLEFSSGLDLWSLQNAFGCAFSYVYPSPQGFSALAYPLFAPAAYGTQPSQYPGFNVRLHPLHALDSSQTRLALDLLGSTTFAANSRKLQSSYFTTVNGGSIVLIPVDPAGDEATAPGSPMGPDPGAAGFGFCRTLPCEGSPESPSLGLAPVGTFVIQNVTGPGQSRPSKRSQAGAARWMCGLFGQEYLSVAVDDRVEFISGCPALAPGFSTSGAPDSSAGAALTSAFTTSWMTLLAGSPHAYFAQPSSSVYYAAAPDDNYPAAVDSLLSTFESSAPFPIVPYGGIFAGPSSASEARSGSSPYAAFEAAVLSSVRHETLATPGRGPQFSSTRPTMAAIPARLKKHLRATVDAAESSAPPTALTPQGLIVDLTRQGEWASVLLAQSPDAPGLFLQFRGADNGHTASAALSSMLVQNQLFLVATRPEPLGTFDAFLRMSGFQFNLQVGPAETLLIFKYNTSLSLRDLVERPTLWAGASEFVGDSQALLAAQQAIRAAIETAASDADAPGAPFAYFNQIVNRPDWSGILALNCAIDGNGMPPDLQILLGGIQGQLRAHHFGIEANRVLPASGGAVSMGQSSLFGVIHYENPASCPPSPDADFAYAVETLTVVFSNSKIAALATSVGLTVNRLFERPVALTGGAASPDIPNTLVIHGQYQTQGGVGTVVFSSDTAFVYSVPSADGATRVINEVHFTHASLTPVYSTPITSPQTGTLVRASFALSGELWFSPQPFPTAPGLDLFSYGNPGQGGLAFTGLTVFIDFQLNEAGSLQPGSESVTLQPALIGFAPTDKAVRPHALMKSMPLDYSRFWYSPTGLTAGSLGALPLHCMQLEEQGTAASPGAVGPFPCVTASPHYALEFDLPLGTLGSLSDVGVALTAKLLLAWGPSTVVPDNDAAAILVQMPSVMGGIDGFTLQGILRTTFGDANLLMVDVDGASVYSILFNNIKFSLLGFSFPPGVLIDFLIFAGQPASGAPVNGSNIAWYLAAQPVPGASSSQLPHSSAPLLEGVL